MTNKPTHPTAGVRIYVDPISTSEGLAEALFEHEDQGGCCECGGDHTCQDCPTFIDGDAEEVDPWVQDELDRMDES